MASTTSNLVCDNSTLANFKVWAQFIANGFGTTCGWTQTNDTGQVVWTASSVPIASVATSGGNTTYTYDATTATGPVLRVGMSMIMTNCGTNNNVTATITALGGSGASSTFTVVNTGSNQGSVAGTGVTTAIAAVPSSTYVYEIWKQADGLTGTLQIFVKMEYGFSSTLVGMRVTVGTGSNGTGTITGAIAFSSVTPSNMGSTGTIANQGGTQFGCYLSGDTSEFRFLMWNPVSTSNTTGMPCLFLIERSKDNTGANTGEYVTCVAISGRNTGTQGCIVQQSITSGLLVTTASKNIWTFGLDTTVVTGSFAGTVAAFPVFPLVGKCGNPMLGLMTCSGPDVADNTVVTVTSMYGSTHTFVSCKSGENATASGFNAARQAINAQGTSVLMRYE